MDRKPMIETSTIDVRHDAGTGNKCVNQYVMQATLGKGSYGKVKLAIDETTGAQVAIKIVNKARLKKKRTFGRFGVIDPLSGIRQEVAVMKKLDHVNVVKLLEVIDNPDAEKLYLVMEFVARGPILDLRSDACEPLPEPVCRSYMRDIVNGLRYLHFNHIAHRDIKPENLLLSDSTAVSPCGTVKIADFGVSLLFEGDNDFVKATAGSVAFMAPEMCAPDSFMYSAKKTDVWSAGVTLFAMVFGQCPITATSTAEMYDRICNSTLTLPWPIHPRQEHLIRRMLDKNPDTRITLDEIKKDPWLIGDGVTADDHFERVSVTVDDVDKALTLVNRVVMLVRLKTKVGRIRRSIRGLPPTKSGTSDDIKDSPTSP
ncbi:unnamed protein product (mitochondrion) [Plasmodiophora brassicae]|uniref:Protein kinase domain-containing protein n=1 Tax=Plasmodiophora brassicae TaxID=37360 RepID=A0A0G4IIB9_PLABS|nr:hypothetical protein PBRA_003771 [Plasmodiophora brassicae]SPQ94289.1 unnamed protein product [Plasmodiophora brassicae]